MDPSYPQERIDYMCNDAGLGVVLTQKDYLEKIPQDLTWVNMDETTIYDSQGSSNLRVEQTSENLIYVMYTSGSTGKPKGVMVEHKGVVRLVKNTNYLDGLKEVNMTLLAPYAFDAPTLEIWAPLINECKLVICD